MAVGLLAGAGLALAGGAANWWSDRGDRKRAQRFKGLLKGKFKDTGWTDTRKESLLGKNTRASNVASSQLESDLDRAAAAGVNPTLLNEKRKAFMLAKAEQAAQLGGNLETAAVQATGLRRAELQNKIDATPSGWESFIGGAQQGLQMGANVASIGKSVEGIAASRAKRFDVEIADLLGTGSRRGSALEG